MGIDLRAGRFTGRGETGKLQEIGVLELQHIGSRELGCRQGWW